jgi:hypothetical protein
MAMRRYKSGGRVLAPAAIAVPETNAPVTDQAAVEPPAATILVTADNALKDQLEALRLAEAAVARQAAASDARVENELKRQLGADPVAAAIESMAHLSARQRDWLKTHRDAYTDPAKNAYLGAAHWDAIRAGHAQDSDEYFALLEERLGYRQPARVANIPAPPPPSPTAAEPTQRRMSIPVSAPVSREAPNLGGGNATPSRVELTSEQREAARIAGVSEVEYARNLLRLNQMKRDGHYQERG